MPAAAADNYGIRNLGVNYGILFTAFGVAGVGGPILAGRIRDTFGSYQHAFTICAILLIVGTLLSFFAQPRQTQLQSVTLASSPRS
jgi:OFA family oxalate/formate antiporter-like MFS transporter